MRVVGRKTPPSPLGSRGLANYCALEALSMEWKETMEIN
jgi:hypothetical protein